MISPEQIIDSYHQIIEDRINDGWHGYLLTFMFNNVAGSEARVLEIMKHEVERFYATLLSRIVRKPATISQVGRLPILVGCPDRPVPKHNKKMLQDVRINDGLHMHAAFVMPPVTRMKCRLNEHLSTDQERYVRDPLRLIDAEELYGSTAIVMDYIMKQLKRGMITNDHILLLPRALSEVVDFTAGHKRKGRPSWPPLVMI